jgi:hypothetical protein
VGSPSPPPPSPSPSDKECTAKEEEAEPSRVAVDETLDLFPTFPAIKMLLLSPAALALALALSEGV